MDLYIVNRKHLLSIHLVAMVMDMSQVGHMQLRKINHNVIKEVGNTIQFVIKEVGNTYMPICTWNLG